MNLYIDSTDNTRTVVRVDGKEFSRQVSSPRDQDVLGMVISSLEGSKLSPSDITSIEVNRGPGSFTGTRVGVCVANALGFSLGVPVNGQMSPCEPIYNSPPSTTVSKKG